MFKRILMLLLFATAPFSIAAEISQIATPRVIVAWDLHSVLFHRTLPLFRQHQVKPLIKTFEIVKELADKGIEQHILSNIDEEAFKKVVKRYPNYFLYFDLEKSQVKTDSIKKPQELYFLNYLDKNSIDPTETVVIFIDDIKANVTGAQRTGIYGIRFKKPEQVRKELKALGLL